MLPRTRATLSVFTAAAALSAVTFMVTGPAGATVSTQLQTAQDTLENCQLLADNSIGEQHARAEQCVADQQQIISLLTTPTASLPPSPTSLPTAATSPPATTAPPVSPTPTPTIPPASPTSIPPVSTSPTSSATPPTPPAFPNPLNTGVPAGWVPTQVRTTDLVVTQPGTVIQDVRLLNADIRIRAANVTIRRVEVQGGQIWNDGPASSCTGTTLIEDTSIIKSPGQVTRYDDGPVIGPGGYTLRRVKVDGPAEGIRIGEKTRCGPVSVYDSYINVVPPGICGDWHGDGLQGYQGAALLVRNSTFRMIVTNNAPCEGTSPFFYPNQGNTSADLDHLLVIGGKYYAFRLGVTAKVHDLNVVGAVDVKCSRVTAWQANTVTIDSAYRISSSRSLPCTTEGGN